MVPTKDDNTKISRWGMIKTLGLGLGFGLQAIKDATEPRQ